MSMDPSIEEKYILAGKIAKEALERSLALVKPGAALLDVAEQLEAIIRDRGGLPAFPINLSLNEFAAHYTPYKGDETKVKESDVLKVDIGVHVDGYVADAAHTIHFDSKHDKLVEASKSAVEESIKLIKPGALLDDISAKIEATIKSFGYNPVSNLTGHGLERYHLHAEPAIHNVVVKTNYRLKEDHVIAIEPFATPGGGYVKDSEPVFIFMLLQEKPVRNQDGRQIMDFARRFNGLPFAERWLPLSLFRTRIALRELREKGVVYDYAPLREASGGVVSQHEHTIIVRDPPVVITK